MSKKKWLGSTKCDICGTECTNEDWFVDGATRQGPWALMCPTCFDMYGTKIGQKYNHRSDKICNLADQS